MIGLGTGFKIVGSRYSPDTRRLREFAVRNRLPHRWIDLEEDQQAEKLLDNLGIHTPKGSLLLRQLLKELRGQLVLVYTPAYDPESNRIEWLWRSLRRAVTHTHTRETLSSLLEDADTWARTITPVEVLRQIGSPFADDLEPADDQSLVHAA